MTSATSHTTQYHRSGTRFVVPQTDPDNKPIPERWAGKTGVIVGHTDTAVLNDFVEEVYEVRYDDAAHETAFLSDRWMSIEPIAPSSHARG